MKFVATILCCYLMHFTVSQKTDENLHKNMEQFQKDLQVLMTQNERLSDEVNHLKVKDELMQQEMNGIKNENRNLKEQLQSLENKVSNEESTYRQQNSSGVGFTAYAKTTLDYSTNDVILFDGISRNYGNAYDPISGIFVCPVSGFYLFFIGLHTWQEDYMYGEVYMEGDERGLFEVYSDVHNYDQSAGMAYTYCEAGQQVWGRCSWSGGRLYGDEYDWRSIFSGALIQEATALH